MALELLYALACGYALEPDRVIVRARCYERRIGREGYRADLVIMALERLYALARGHALEPDRLVVRARCHERRIAREGHRSDRVIMALGRLHALARGHAPEPDRVVVRGRRHERRIEGPHKPHQPPGRVLAARTVTTSHTARSSIQWIRCGHIVRCTAAGKLHCSVQT